jgi:hypothetical protein
VHSPFQAIQVPSDLSQLRSQTCPNVPSKLCYLGSAKDIIQIATMVFLIGDEGANTPSYPNWFLDWNSASFKIIPKTGNSITKWSSCHVRSDAVQSDIELSQIVTGTPHKSHNLEISWNTDIQGTPCLAIEYPGIGSPMYPAVDVIITIHPFFWKFRK